MWVHFVHQHVLDTVLILEEGKFPTPTVRPVRHAGPLEGTERVAPGYRTVTQGIGMEETVDGRGGDA